MLIRLFSIDCRYVDDSLIPSDPDNAPSAVDSSGFSASPVVIPWVAAGDEEADAINSQFAMETDDNVRLNAIFKSACSFLILQGTAAMLSVLPECLHHLDHETLMLLVQDENNIQAILNPDGTVNAAKVELLRRGQLNVYGAPGRAGFIDDFSFGQKIPQQPLLSGGLYYEPASALPFSAAPMIAPTLSTFADDLALSARMASMPSSASNAAKAQKQFKYPTKAATPCRFFNTPKGCQFGDKCAFGHFREHDEDDFVDRDSDRKSRRRNINEDDFGRARR
jgi:hypothetical protein